MDSGLQKDKEAKIIKTETCIAYSANADIQVLIKPWRWKMFMKRNRISYGGFFLGISTKDQAARDPLCGNLTPE